jgi:hypothetical protein
MTGVVENKLNFDIKPILPPLLVFINEAYGTAFLKKEK